MNRQVVFDRERRRPVGPAAVRYFVLVVALLAMNYGLLSAMSAIGAPLLAAKLLTELALVAVSYVTQSRFVFAAGRLAAAAPASVPSDEWRSLAATQPRAR